MTKHSAYVPLSLLLLAAGMTAPAYAQDAAQDAAAPAADSAAPADAAADATAADTTSADAAAPADSSAAAGDTSADAAGSDTASTDTASADSSASESSETSSASREPFYLYGGLDYAFLRTSLSKDSLKTALGGDEFDSNFYRLRVGTRIFPAIGIEAQYGIKGEDGSGQGKVETNQMYGLYIVPTGNLFRFIEVSAPIGYSHLRLENGNGRVNFDSLSFGFNVEFPVFVNPESKWPDVRIGGGGTVFYAEREARTYGYHAGVRLDFKI